MADDIEFANGMKPTKDLMVEVAYSLDNFFNNGDLENRKVGFALFVFNLDEPGMSNYISNAEREGMTMAIAEWLAKQPKQ